MAKKKIRYKCVSEGRFSSQITCGAYRLHYPKGQIVEAPKHSMGIFVFESRRSARSFMSSQAIIRVEGIGRPQKRKYILCPSDIRQKNNLRSSWRWYLDKWKKRWKTIMVPTGTLCYPAVKVLD